MGGREATRMRVDDLSDLQPKVGEPVSPRGDFSLNHGGRPMRFRATEGGREASLWLIELRRAQDEMRQRVEKKSEEERRLRDADVESIKSMNAEHATKIAEAAAAAACSLGMPPPLLKMFACNKKERKQ